MDHIWWEPSRLWMVVYIMTMTYWALPLLKKVKGEHTAILATLVDWSSAFDRQDLTLAIKSFQENGVRDSLIPILMSFFEGRKMFVSWQHLRNKGPPRRRSSGHISRPLVISEPDQRQPWKHRTRKYFQTRTTTSLSRCLLLVLTLFCPGWGYLNI